MIHVYILKKYKYNIIFLIFFEAFKIYIFYFLNGICGISFKWILIIIIYFLKLLLCILKQINIKFK